MLGSVSEGHDAVQHRNNTSMRRPKGGAVRPGPAAARTKAASPSDPQGARAPAAGSTVDEMLFLQRTAGNQAVDQRVRQVRRTSGEPLAASSRTLMESRFGRDLSHVRVHTDPDAAASASSLHAEAYTVDQDMVFAEGRFSPDTTDGRTLLAHELAHTIQQREGAGASPTNDPQGVHESTARAAAQEVAAGQPAQTAQPAASVGLSMTPEDDKRAAAIAEAERVGRRPAPEDDAEETVDTPVPKATLDPLYRTPGFEAPLWSDSDIADPMLRVMRDRDAEPGEVKRRQVRTRRTRKYFDKVSDARLPEAYRKGLQRYLDEGLEANNHWDLRTIEAIVQERAPDAPWIDETRDEVLAAWQIKRRDEKRRESLPTLPMAQRAALGELDRRTAKWTDEEKALAHDLLREWFERQDEGQGRHWIQRQVLDSLVDRYEGWMRNVDQLIQEEARRRPKPVGFVENLKRGLENAWGDQSEPWFEEGHQHGHFERHDFDAWLRVTTREENEPPLDLVYYSVQEFRMRTNPEMQLRKLQAQGLLGLGVGTAALAARVRFMIPRSTPSGPPVKSPPGSSRNQPGWFRRKSRAPVLGAYLGFREAFPDVMDIGSGQIGGRTPIVAVQPRVTAPPSTSAAPGQVQSPVPSFPRFSNVTSLNEAFVPGSPKLSTPAAPAPTASRPMSAPATSTAAAPTAEGRVAVPDALRFSHVTQMSSYGNQATDPSFAEVSAAVEAEAPGTITYGSQAEAALGARVWGLESPTSPGFGTYSTASSIRQAFHVTGAQYEAAHLAHQALYRALRREGRDVSQWSALTLLLPREAHRAFDRGWVGEWNNAVANGDEIRAIDAYTWISNALHAVDESLINSDLKGAIQDRLRVEMFGDLDLSPETVIIKKRP